MRWWPTVTAAWRTWGATGLRRRVTYELQLRAGAVERAEQRWLRGLDAATIGLADIRPVRPPASKHRVTAPRTTSLYGSIDVDLTDLDWHRHPTTDDVFPPNHWRVIAVPPGVDIKDVWELGRLSWIGGHLRAAVHDTDAAERVWQVIESFAQENPPYRGPHWMCGQESSLRGVQVAAVVSALADSPATTDARRTVAAHLLAVTVGRVAPTLRYALSQRNNHATSEAAFLWTATHLLSGLPDGERIRSDAADALTEAIADQWYADGAYAQHSPTYQRLAVHALLWVLAVSRAAEAEAPTGVTDAVRRSAEFLTRIGDVGTGHLPNIGGNDGALLFRLSDSTVTDFRPLLAHAAAAVGTSSPVGAGPWQEEGEWFGLSPATKAAVTPASDDGGVSFRVHRGPRSFAVLRAGPLRHRPAHADQLHVDVWIDGVNVARDAGSYRYAAPPPWENALALETTHNVPRVAGAPQATRRGRFFWASWSEASIVATHRGRVDATIAELQLPGGALVRRLLLRRGDVHAIADRCSAPCVVRWNLPPDAKIQPADGGAEVVGPAWQAIFAGGENTTRARDHHDPDSGWWAPTYARLEPVLALELTVDAGRAAVARFGPIDATLTNEAFEELLDASSSAALAVLLT